jgi:hypothetical protein
LSLVFATSPLPKATTNFSLSDIFEFANSIKPRLKSFAGVACFDAPGGIGDQRSGSGPQSARQIVAHPLDYDQLCPHDGVSRR